MQNSAYELLQTAATVVKELNRHKIIQKARKEDLLRVEAAHNEAVEQHRGELQDLKEQREAIEVMKKLIGILSEKGMKHLQALLTYGMDTIYYDRSYQVEIKVDEFRNNKAAEFWIIKKEKNGRTIRVRMRNGVGGGIRAVVSLILRIHFIISLELRRFLIIDEGLCQLSSQYVPGLFEFLQSVIQDLGFKILFVTQDPRFPVYGNRIYNVAKGRVTLKRKGEDDG